MTSDAPNDAGELQLPVSVGEAMTIAGDSIESVRQRLLAVAAARGVDEVRVVDPAESVPDEFDNR